MTNRSVNNPDEQIHSLTEEKLASALSCEASLIRDVWQELGIDNSEDPHELSDLEKTADAYLSASKHSSRLCDLIGSLSDKETERLMVEKNDLVASSMSMLEKLSKELSDLHDHRKSVIERNPRHGGKDPKADKLAELVAKIFEYHQRPVTFGQFEGNPTTQFCKSVKLVLEICEAKRFEDETRVSITEWRQPSRKAYEKRKPNTNSRIK